MRKNKLYYYDIAIPKPVSTFFTYSCERLLEKGTRALVPFGKQTLVGTIIKRNEPSFPPKTFKVLDIKELIDKKPVYSKQMLHFAQWLSAYYHHPLGLVLSAMLPQSNTQILSSTWRLTPDFAKKELIMPHDPYILLTKKLFSHKTTLTTHTIKSKYRKLSQQTATPQPSLEKLSQKEWIVTAKQKKPETKNLTRPTDESEELQKGTSINKLVLTPRQELVYKQLIGHIQTGDYKPILLHGITGSGKTELYSQTINALIFDNKKTSSCKKQALIMVPEIALTPQITNYFKYRFPNNVTLVHSGMSEQERWHRLLEINEGRKQILIGPRSSIFAPFKNLKLIIVDEEHDSSYKQQNTFSYHGRDAAVMRAQIEKCFIILGSATPSLESFLNTQTKKYHLLELNQRISSYPLPKVTLISSDNQKKKESPSVQNEPRTQLKETKSSFFISEKIIGALKETKARNEQAIVIVNRRGYAHYLFNVTNKKPFECPNCNISLTIHQAMTRLICHYCLFEVSMSSLIKKNPKSKLTAVGFGSQKAETYLKKMIPEAQISRIDSDSITQKNYLQTTLKEFSQGKIDILIGTQMIAKGHNFPKVTLVALLEVDHLLNLPDFRAGEKTFQLLVQASGRAGRADLPGQVLIQTINKENFVINSAINHDYRTFVERELSFRKAHQYPPFSKMIQLELSSLKKEYLDNETTKIMNWFNLLKQKSPNYFDSVKILGPFAPSIEKLRNRYRKQILLYSKTYQPIHQLMLNFSKNYKKTSSHLRLTIVTDPDSTL